jgi:hypothetical protein
MMPEIWADLAHWGSGSCSLGVFVSLGAFKLGHSKSMGFYGCCHQSKKNHKSSTWVCKLTNHESRHIEESLWIIHSVTRPTGTKKKSRHRLTDNSAKI